jgi:endothelin-converting enzyme/putative endopeptidase
MVKQIRAALEADISGLDWMSDATRRAALEKLRALADKIGYPDRWRDYSALRIARADPLGNRLRASAFEMREMMSTIGHPPDSGSWLLTAPTVNALTNFFQNSITIPAGILQPPFYAAGRDPAVNFGGIGTTIGHELTHGFDTQGRHFDAAGTIRDWWTPADARAFDARAACFVEEFSEFAVDGVRLNGRLTVGENISDAGGVRLALLAYVASEAAPRQAVKDGFTPEQRFFIAYAQKYCHNARPEAAANAARQPTPPGQFRVNGILSNMPEFQKAFTCAADAPMVRTPACRVW